MKYGTTVAAMLVFIFQTSAAEDAGAAKAIGEAIKILQSARDAAKAEDDKIKLSRAIFGLQGIARAKHATENHLVPNLADKTASFKGKTVVLEVTYECPGTDVFLRHLSGKAAKFYAFAPGTTSQIDILANLPSALEIPDARDGDKLILTFECTEGSLTRGNVAKLIKRK
jgi:hypothetical protein